MADKDDDVVNVDLDPEDALVILLNTDLREPDKEDEDTTDDESESAGAD